MSAVDPLDAWLRRHQRGPWRFLRMCGCPADVAEELTQEVLLAALELRYRGEASREAMAAALEHSPDGVKSLLRLPPPTIAAMQAASTSTPARRLPRVLWRWLSPVAFGALGASSLIAGVHLLLPIQSGHRLGDQILEQLYRVCVPSIPAMCLGIFVAPILCLVLLIALAMRCKENTRARGR